MKKSMLSSKKRNSDLRLMISLSVLFFASGILFSGFILNKESETSVLQTHKVAQIGIVVKDIEKASAQFAELFGIEKPDCILAENPEDNPTRYAGELTEAGCKLAFINLENIQLELIEPLGKPSTWNDFLVEKGGGIHHLGFWVENMDDKMEKLKEMKINEVQRGGWTGGQYCYLETPAEMGIFIELLENFNK